MSKISVLFAVLLMGTPFFSTFAVETKQPDFALQGVVRVEKAGDKNWLLVKIAVAEISRVGKEKKIISAPAVVIESSATLKVYPGSTDNVSKVYGGNGKNLLPGGCIVKVSRSTGNKLEILMTMIVHEKPFIVYFDAPVELNKCVEFFNFLPTGWNKNIFMSPDDVFKLLKSNKKQ